MSELALVDAQPQTRSAQRRPLLLPMGAQAVDAPRGPYGPLELPALLYALFRDGFTGELRLRRGRASARVAYRKGRPCSIDGPDSDVGLRLFSAGLLTDDQYSQACDISKQAHIGQGDAIVRMGCLDHDKLRLFLRPDLNVTLLDFARAPGEYGLVFDLDAPEHEGSVLEASPFALVFACVSLTSPAALVHHFDKAGNRHLTQTANAKKYASAIDAYPQARPVLDEVSGVRTVGRVLAASPVGLVETLRVLRALQFLDCVSIGDVLEESEPAPQNHGEVARRLTATSKAPGPAPAVASARPSSPPRARRTSAPLPKLDQVDVGDLLQRTHHRLGKMNYYELLGVDPQADPDVIQTAYRDRVKLFSREVVERLRDPQLVEMARQITEQLFAAIQVLRDPRRRAAYDAVHCDVLPPQSSGIDVVAAEDAWHRGRIALQEGLPVKALEYFERAVGHDAHTPLYRMWRGWARFHVGMAAKDRGVMVEGHEDLRKALLDDATQDEGFVLLAGCYEHTARRDSAVRYYRKALGINRRNADAKAGLERLERANQTGRKPSGGFRLFKK